ncbi:hypothetical protein CRG98_027107 [Punica granatum]|uniref:Uncharacterized protein n=1 Tax=Punica granatum TaxID=22663 RepID=A0A2I0J8H3_PUNGR|nr:hypothetical protein CRG98_027107 [Punica granatum]
MLEKWESMLTISGEVEVDVHEWFQSLIEEMITRRFLPTGKNIHSWKRERQISKSFTKLIDGRKRKFSDGPKLKADEEECLKDIADSGL